jgi:hypothetical protein
MATLLRCKVVGCTATMEGNERNLVQLEVHFMHPTHSDGPWGDPLGRFLCPVHGRELARLLGTPIARDRLVSGR